jgi:hypothetical protein
MYPAITSNLAISSVIDLVAMQENSCSSLCLAKPDKKVVDQPGHFPFFKLPLEVRLEIYSYFFTKTILHVEALHPYIVNEQGIWVCPELQEPYGDLLEGRDYEVKPNGDVVLLKHSVGRPKQIRRFVEIRQGATWSKLFTLYCCTSTKPFESVSACPPGYCDHVDCGKIRAGLPRSIRHTCRQAYTETASLAYNAKLHTALQFSDLQDLEAFSMLLTDDQREEIRDIRINLRQVRHSLPTWHYFCNVFATPWDRRSVKCLFDDDDDYPNHKAEISFYYNYSSHDLSDDDSARSLASSWVMPNIHLEWKFRSSSWGMVVDLWDLKARLPLSVRFAMPQFLARTDGGEIDTFEEIMWDDATGNVLSPGDEGYVRLAERNLIEGDAIQDLLAEKKKILASVKAEEKQRFQTSYDAKFHHYWHAPHSDQDLRNWGPGWLRPLQQCQHFASFDVDFYDEDGPRTSAALEILRDGLKERFTALSIGPHPFLLYNH